MNSCFKDLLPKLNRVKDKRNQSYIVYKTEELLYVMLIANIMTINSISGITESFNKVTDNQDEIFRNIIF